MVRKARKYHSPQEKVAILRKHLIEKITVSQICREADLKPTVFYRWQQELFENATAAFEGRRDRIAPLERTIQALEERLACKDRVIAELLEEHFALKRAIPGRN